MDVWCAYTKLIAQTDNDTREMVFKDQRGFACLVFKPVLILFLFSCTQNKYKFEK